MKSRVKYWIAGAALLVAGGVFVAAENPDFKLGRNIEIMINMFRDVSTFYVDETDPDQLLHDAAMGMSMGLDPYTELMQEEDMQDFEILTTGKYGGIGSMIRQKDGYVVIAEPYRGFPADKAGLQIGDRLLEIDGESVVGTESAKVSAKLKGDPGTQLTLKVLKLATGKEETVTLTRERINISGIPYYGMIGDGVGYIKHNDFSEHSSDDLRRAFMEMREGGDLRGLVLDYRGNGGGILDEAVSILSMFVPKGTEVVRMQGRIPEANAVFTTKNEPIDLEIPIVVLTNSASASAAEIVSGALQDLDRAVLVGQRTYGKGLVQRTMPAGYNSLLKITTAKYYIPSGRCIQAIDYAHRNEEGAVASVPDSLVTEFTTRNGRKVYDGGGVMPDVRIHPEYANMYLIPAYGRTYYVSLFTGITYNRGYIDDFCDEYTRRNPRPVDPATFEVTDRIYDQFVKFMADKDVEYQSRTKLSLAALKQNAELELYYNDIKDEIAAIEGRLKDDKNNSLRLYRDQLAELIRDDLVMRHHYSQGVTEYKIRHDDEVAEAVAILKDAERYARIVTSQDTPRK